MRESNPAYSGVSTQAGAETLSKLLTTSTGFPPTGLRAIPAESVSEGKLLPPAFHASTLKL